MASEEAPRSPTRPSAAPASTTGPSSRSTKPTAAGWREQLEAEAANRPGWEVERTRYMVWSGGEVDLQPDGAREVGLGGDRGAATDPAPGGDAVRVDELEATVEQLLDIDRRYGAAAGDRWFVAPAEGEPLSACRLLRGDGIGQVEDVVTRADARERGYAKAVVLAAVAAAQAAGDTTIFLTADAADWPQFFYSRWASTRSASSPSCAASPETVPERPAALHMGHRRPGKSVRAVQTRVYAVQLGSFGSVNRESLPGNRSRPGTGRAAK